jgi:hypothetical protein
MLTVRLRRGCLACARSRSCRRSPSRSDRARRTPFPGGTHPDGSLRPTPPVARLFTQDAQTEYAIPAPGSGAFRIRFLREGAGAGERWRRDEREARRADRRGQAERTSSDHRTLKDPAYKVVNGDPVFERTLHGLRNTVLLPPGPEVAAVSQSATLGMHQGRAFVALINLTRRITTAWRSGRDAGSRGWG